jgi:DNA polymerase III subunit epsilon
MNSFPVKLDRPLIVFDIEATGTSPRADRIIELAAIRIEPDGTEVNGYWLLNPEMSIPEDSIAIHGITNDIVKDCPTFKAKALEILTFFGEADLAGFNAGRFDIPMLAEEFGRAGIIFDPDRRRLLDAQRIFHTKEPRDLTAALKFYCGDAHTDAHGAEADVRATLNVLLGQFKRYPDLPKDIETLDKTFNPTDPFNADRSGRLRWVEGELTINFGKKKGFKVRDLVNDDPGFLKWIIKNDFPQDTRQICDNALKGIFPQAPRAKQLPAE